MNIYLQKRQGRRSKTSLYLLYVNGKRRYYEFLKLYLFDPAKDHLQRQHNKEVLKLANTILAQKVLDHQYSQHGLISPLKGKVGLLQYFQKVMAKKQDSAGNAGSWKSTLKHVTNFLKGTDVPLDKVDELFLQNFQSFLLTETIARGGRKLSRNAALSYESKLKSLLKQAWKERYIKENIAVRTKNIKPAEVHRTYLTQEELKKLLKTDYRADVLRISFLFACYTGLRFSDLQKIEWSQFNFSEATGWTLTFTQKKTKGAEVLPIAYEAMELLANFSASDGKVFPNLLYSSWNNMKLREWLFNAGIVKPVSFHVSRHTFATLALSMNTDIYTVSKLLGHKNLKTTQQYTKVVDLKKVEAVNKFSFLN